VITVAHPPGWEAERAYVVSVVFGEWLGLPFERVIEEREDWALRLAGQELRVADAFFAREKKEWLQAESLPLQPLPRWAAGTAFSEAALVAGELPVLYGAMSAGGRWQEPEWLGVDVFGSVFFLLTRYEEVVRAAARDAHERFPARASIAWQEGFLERPLADEYVELLWAAMVRLWPQLERKRQAFALVLSHDVDWPLMTNGQVPLLMRQLAGDLWRRRDLQLAGQRLRSFAAVRQGRWQDDPYHTFDELMSGSERGGWRSAFYLIAEQTAGVIDGVYALSDPYIQALLQAIHARGHEVGLHPSYRTFRDPVQLKREFQRLRAACEVAGVEQSAWGGRQHFLRFETPGTWRALATAGLDYDSTLGYAEAPGFRCGTCREYPVWDVEQGRLLPLRERPLVVMEQSLLHPAYLGLTAEAAAAKIEQLRQACQRVQGLFTVLWHNSQLLKPSERELYHTAVLGR